MSDTLKDARDAVLEHLPSRDAVLDHLPSRDDVDVSAITDRLSDHKPGKRGLVAIVLGLIAAAGAVVVARRKRAETPVSASIYTPPLPKP